VTATAPATAAATATATAIRSENFLFDTRDLHVDWRSENSYIGCRATKLTGIREYRGYMQLHVQRDSVEGSWVIEGRELERDRRICSENFLFDTRDLHVEWRSENSYVGCRAIGVAVIRG